MMPGLIYQKFRNPCYVEKLAIWHRETETTWTVSFWHVVYEITLEEMPAQIIYSLPKNLSEALQKNLSEASWDLVNYWGNFRKYCRRIWATRSDDSYDAHLMQNFEISIAYFTSKNQTKIRQNHTQIWQDPTLVLMMTMETEKTVHTSTSKQLGDDEEEKKD